MPAGSCLLRYVALFLPLLCALFAADTRSAEEPERNLHIAVAANFRPSAERLGRQFERDEGIAVLLSSAATGVLSAQWRRGAPFDLLLAADRARPEALSREGHAADTPRCYALGSLVLLGADSLEAALGDPRRSIAIANPRSAPYGAAAMAVLQRPDFASSTERRVLRGGNVMQALQFFRSGASDLALVARSLSRDAGLPVPADWHPPIEQYAIVNPRSRKLPQARAFLSYLLGPKAATTLKEFGYRACS